MRADIIRRIIRAYDDPVVRAYCWVRFGIRRQRFLDEIGQYLALLQIEISNALSAPQPPGARRPLERARELAQAWGSRLVNIGPAGHINGDSGLGDWPEGKRLLRHLIEGERIG